MSEHLFVEFSQGNLGCERLEICLNYCASIMETEESFTFMKKENNDTSVLFIYLGGDIHLSYSLRHDFWSVFLEASASPTNAFQTPDRRPVSQVLIGVFLGSWRQKVKLSLVL